MEFRQLNTFIQVAKFQSFSKAAEHLGYSQSAVTVQIRMLEKELNTRLFDRMGKKILLTSQGQESEPPLPPPIGRVVNEFLNVCSKARNFRMLRFTEAWKRTTVTFQCSELLR